MSQEANANPVAAPASPATASTSVVAQPQDARPAVAKKPLGIAARAKAMGAKAAPTESKSKAKTPIVKVSDEIRPLLDQFVEAGSRKDAAEGEMKVYGGQIRPAAEALRVAESRKANSVFKSIDLEGRITYSWPKGNAFGVGPIDNKEKPEQGKKNADVYKAGLREVFGDELYEKYFTEADTLVLKPEVPGNPVLVDRLFRLLEGDPTVLLPEDKANNVEILFNTEPWVELRKVGENGVLQSDMTLDPKTEALVNVAVQKGLIVIGNGSLTAKKAAASAAVQNIADAAKAAAAPTTQITINPAK